MFIKFTEFVYAVVYYKYIYNNFPTFSFGRFVRAELV